MTSNVQITGPDLKLKMNWSAVVDVVTELGVQGVAIALGVPPGPKNISGVIGKLKGVVKVDEPLESKAWTVVALCFASAIDELRPQTASEELRANVRNILNGTKLIIQNNEYFLTPEFFINPVSLPLYCALRGKLVEGLRELWPDDHDVGGRLDSAFNSALYELNRHDSDLIETLRETVRGPGFEANQNENDWIAYRERLKHEFYLKPVFGQEETHVSLSQLYIPPRAHWTEKRVDEQDDPDSIRHLVNLHTNMQDWLSNAHPGRCIRLIQGGPGCGKSSFTKYFAANLADDANWRPILIELQRLRGTGSLSERTTRLLTEQQEVFGVSPFDRAHFDDHRPLVLIFDGLDKLDFRWSR